MLVLESEEQFIKAAAFGALSGASITWMAYVIDWFVAQGLPPDQARALIGSAPKRYTAQTLTDPEAVLAAVDIGAVVQGRCRRRRFHGCRCCGRHGARSG